MIVCLGTYCWQNSTHTSTFVDMAMLAWTETRGLVCAWAHLSSQERHDGHSLFFVFTAAIVEWKEGGEMRGSLPRSQVGERMLATTRRRENNSIESVFARSGGRSIFFEGKERRGERFLKA